MTTEAPLFLTDEEMVRLTGFKRSSKQIAHLKAQRIPHFTNACGQPRIARAVLEGRKTAKPKEETWNPPWAPHLR